MAVDYDPQKAHEYYEKHKKLKGRHSTKGFDDTKKAQWAYAKSQLAEEHKDIRADITADSKNKRQQLSESAKSAIEALRAKLKTMPKEQRARYKEQIQSMIAGVREKLKASKADLTADTAKLREQENADYETRKDEAYKRIKGG